MKVSPVFCLAASPTELSLCSESGGTLVVWDGKLAKARHYL